MPRSRRKTRPIQGAKVPALALLPPDTRFKPGHKKSLHHGLYTERWPAGKEHLQADVDRFIAGQLSDEGDERDITTRRRNLLEIRANVVWKNILKLNAVLEDKGLLDSKGKLRVQWLTMLATYI